MAAKNKKVKRRTRFTDEDISLILDRLEDEYPDAGCALTHMDVYELLICVVLSAQTTDVSVNRVTHGGMGDNYIWGPGEGLFDAYPDAKSLAEASQEDVMEKIRTIGMYKTKSRNIINLAKALCEQYDGQVPEDYDALVALPGVGRKTANVVLAVGFGQQRIAVDTHVFRVSHRIGLAVGSDSASGAGKSGGRKNGAVAEKSAKSAGAKEVLATEYELMETLPESRWSEAHHSLIFHGRNCCTARNPHCGECVLADICEKNGL